MLGPLPQGRCRSEAERPLRALGRSIERGSPKEVLATPLNELRMGIERGVARKTQGLVVTISKERDRSALAVDGPREHDVESLIGHPRA